MGRPSTYTDEIAQKIIDRLSRGELVQDICKDLGITRMSIGRWLESNESFRSAYARARELQADVHAERAIAAACEEPSRDELGRVDSGAVNAQRLKVDALKWYASKLRPHAYGDRQQLEHTGESGGPIQVITGVPRSKPDDA